MNSKVILISVDGMRPDSVTACGHPFAGELMAQSAYTLEGWSVDPSVTLPCHMSMFYSQIPQRHGVLTNTYTPPVRPVDGIAELAHKAGKTCGAFYSWEPIRHIWQSESMVCSLFLGFPDSDRLLTKALLSLPSAQQPDFLFLHLGETDLQGHRHGWMSPEYLAQVSVALGCAEQIARAAAPGTHIILTADHGGHGYLHGEPCPEDMTIPLFLLGPSFRPGQIPGKAGLLDIAPTVARLLNLSAPADWQGAPAGL